MRNIYLLLISLFLLSGCAHKRINEHYDYQRQHLIKKYSKLIEQIEDQRDEMIVDKNAPLIINNEKIVQNFKQCLKSSSQKKCQDGAFVEMGEMEWRIYSQKIIANAPKEKWCKNMDDISTTTSEYLKINGFKTPDSRLLNEEMYQFVACLELKERQFITEALQKQTDENVKALRDELNYNLRSLEYARHSDILAENAQWNAALNQMSNNLNAINTQQKLNQIQQNQQQINYQNQQMLNNQNQGGQRSKINQPNY